MQVSRETLIQIAKEAESWKLTCQLDRKWLEARTFEFAEVLFAGRHNYSNGKRVRMHVRVTLDTPSGRLLTIDVPATQVDNYFPTLQSIQDVD